MRVGIIAEGKSDQEVIAGILQACKIDKSDIIQVKPENQTDETDKNNPENSNETTIGTLQGVKKACMKNENGARPYFDKFFFIDDQNYMVIHLDTAEIDQQDFDFQKPEKNNDAYPTELRNQVINFINEWLENNYADELLYAIAIEEIEAWILAKFGKNTTKSADPKRTLNHELKKISKNGIVNKEKEKDKIIDEMRKMKTLKPFLKNNKSLEEFVNSITGKIKF